MQHYVPEIPLGTGSSFKSGGSPGRESDPDFRRGRLEAAGSRADHCLEIPRSGPLLTPILAAVPLQRLACHTALIKGADVDQPGNLAKSVTVE